MERVTKLYLEASALRALAERMDMLPIREQLLYLAMRCEKLAKRMEADPEWADLREEEFPADLY
jgi:hypothetical protein